jgi:hypothetical protein
VLRPVVVLAVALVAGCSTKSKPMMPDDAGKGMDASAMDAGTTGPPEVQFSCKGDVAIAQNAVGITAIPAPGGGNAVAAILYGTVANASVEIWDLVGMKKVASATFPGEAPLAIRGYAYDLGANPKKPNRSALAVTTMTSAGNQFTLQIYLYEWTQGMLLPHDRAMRATPFFGDCPEANCATGGSCHLALDMQSTLSIETADVDGDGKADLSVGTSSGLPITTYFSSRTPSGTAFYLEDGCSCAQYAQPPAAFVFADFGGPSEPAGRDDLVLGAAGGLYVRYAIPGDLATMPTCGQPVHAGSLSPLHDIARGHFQCDPTNHAIRCFEDVVTVASASAGNPSQDPGLVRVFFGSSADATMNAQLLTDPNATKELDPTPLSASATPRGPLHVRVGDFNGDAHDDVAVVYPLSALEGHVWLGDDDKTFAEVTGGVSLTACGSGAQPTCPLSGDFAVGDFDGDGMDDIALLWQPSCAPAIRWFAPHRQ